MSRRSSRKRKGPPSEISPAYYVGYAEDEEPVEVIMKKFEELDRLKNELADKKRSEEVQGFSTEGTSTEVPTDMSVSEAQISHTETELTQKDLEELFKRTSSFTVKQAAMGYHPDDFDDLELLRMEYDDIDEFDEENNYEVLPDEAFGEFDDDTGPKRKSAKQNRMRDRHALIEKYRLMQIEMNVSAGVYFIHKKVPYIDPTLPTYIRIPNDKIPRSWAKIIMPLESQKEPEYFCSRQFFTKDIFSFDLQSLGRQHLAVYIDPPLLLPDEEPVPGKITFENLAELDMLSLINSGFIFIWTEKELIPKIIKLGHKWGFKYVENFAWIKLLNNNSIARQSYRYVCKSKTTCLILRREAGSDSEEVELKHQRSPDCEFDFIKCPKEGDLTEEKPSFIYNVIETLLPTTKYIAGVNVFDKPRIVELSWRNIPRREGWDQVIVQR